MADEKQYLSRIRLIDGTTVEVKDQEARSILDSLFTDTLVLDCGSSVDETGNVIE